MSRCSDKLSMDLQMQCTCSQLDSSGIGTALDACKAGPVDRYGSGIHERHAVALSMHAVYSL